MYSPKECESIFTEIIAPNKKSCFLGTIYMHASRKPYKFNNELLKHFLNKIKKEGKGSFLIDDYNFHPIKYTQNRDTAEFLEHIFYDNFNPPINLSTTATPTFIDNILLICQHSKVSPET